MGKTKKQLFLTIVVSLVCSFALFGQQIKHEDYNLKSDQLSKKLYKSSVQIAETDVIEIPIQNPEPFLAVGFKAMFADKSPNAVFEIRSSLDGSEWTDWQKVDEDDTGLMQTEEFFGELSFLDKETKFVQLRVKLSDVDLNELKLSFISPGKTKAENLSLSKSGSAVETKTIDRPNFVSRKSWGCPQSEHVSSRSLTDVTHLIVHHSAGSTFSSDFAAVVRSYWDYHVNGHGWADIGYNWLVDRNGVLYKGRAWKSSTEENVRGAHNSGKNGNTAGICFIGNYETNTPSEEGLDKLAGIMAFLCDKYGIDPMSQSYHAAIGRVNDNIDGHGQSGGGTACPGRKVIDKLNEIRQNTQNKIIDITAAPEVVEWFPTAEIDSLNPSMPISIEFSHPMADQTVVSAFSIEPEVEGSFSWNENGNELTFTPSTKFDPTTEYSVKITTSAKSRWIMPLNEEFNLSFVTKDKNKLSLISYYPEQNETEVPTDVRVELKFDNAVVSTSLGGNIRFVDEDDNDIGIDVETNKYSDGIVAFTPKYGLDKGSDYFVKLRDGIKDSYGFTFGREFEIKFTTKSATDIVEEEGIPSKYMLHQNFPNPFNPTTNIKFSIPEAANVKLEIFNSLGKTEKILVNEYLSPGTHKVQFNAAGYPSGVYLYKLTTNNYSSVKKLILIK